MARKRYSDEDVLNLLRQIELSLASGSSIETACRSAGISDATYYNWRKRYGGMGKSQLQELNRTADTALSVPGRGQYIDPGAGRWLAGLSVGLAGDRRHARPAAWLH
mgnify:CR=1 FL=1